MCGFVLCNFLVVFFKNFSRLKLKVVFFFVIVRFFIVYIVEDFFFEMCFLCCFVIKEENLE